MVKTHRIMLSWVLLVGLLLLSGCGSSDGVDPAATPTVTPPVIDPIPVPIATTRTWTVQGHAGGNGTFDGTFTYKKDAEPTNRNEGLYYSLTAWDIRVHPNTPLEPEPVLVFQHTGSADTAELCFNHCFLDSRDAARLVFNNGPQRLVVLFILPAPHTTLPTEAGDWGVFEPGASYVQSGENVEPSFQYRMTVTDSELVAG